MDRNSFIPSMHLMKELIDECEWIEQNKTPIYQDNDDDNKNNNKKQVREKSKQQKNERKQHEQAADRNVRAHGRTRKFKFNCSKCGKNPTHNTERCFRL